MPSERKKGACWAAEPLSLCAIKDGLRMLEEVLDEAFEEHVVLLTLPTEISENKDIRSVISYFNE